MANESNIWDQSKKVLFIVPFEGIDNLKEYRDAVKLNGFNVNDCQLLAIVEDKKNSERMTEISSVTYLSDKEFNFLGKLKNDQASKVLSFQYDTMILFGDVSKRIARLLNRKNTGRKIGVNSSASFLSINLTSEQKNPHQLFNFVRITLQKIK